MHHLLIQVFNHLVSTLEKAFLHLTQPVRHSFALATATDLPASKSQLIAENALLRRQLIILSHQVKRPRFTQSERLWLVLLASGVRHWKDTLLILKPDILRRWHRQGFRLFWKFKSRNHGGGLKLATALEDCLAHAARLCRFRRVEHGQERYAFDRFIAVGRQAGFLPDRVTLLVVATWVRGGGSVQDRYTLPRNGIRKLLRALGYAMPSKRRGLSPQVQQLLATYLDHDRKAAIDWTDPTQRAAQLQELVQDTEATLELAAEQTEGAEVRSTPLHYAGFTSPPLGAPAGS